MKNILDKVMTMTADAALKAALASIGYASHAGSYQPKEPEELKVYMEKNGSNNR